MRTTTARLVVLGLGLMLVPLSFGTSSPPLQASAQSQAESVETSGDQTEETPLRLHYLEIVTSSLDETCAMMERAHGLTFGEPVPEFGNARTARLRGGGRIGVRLPMRETETPVVRPYVLVDDIHAAIEAAEEAGAEVAMPPMELPGQGSFAIYILGGIEHGLWQN